MGIGLIVKRDKIPVQVTHATEIIFFDFLEKKFYAFVHIYIKLMSHLKDN